MAPPKQGVPIQVRLPQDMLDAIDKRSAVKQRSRAETIRVMLAWALKQPMTKEQE